MQTCGAMTAWPLRIVFVFATVLCFGSSAKAQLTAGIASTSIAPDGPLWLAGDPARLHPSEPGKGDLRARALALDDGSGGRAVLISVELMGVPRALSEMIAADIMRTLGLDRGQILIAASGTRNAPFVQGLQPLLAPAGSEDQRKIAAYSVLLSRSLAELARSAFASMQPARLHAAFGRTALAANTESRLAKGARDATLPVLRVETATGRTLAVVFGSAGRATSTAPGSCAVDGDDAGAAARSVEHDFPGSVALFLQFCDGSPRGSGDPATEHGAALAAEVRRLLQAPMRSVKGRVRSAFIETSLAFVPQTQKQLEAESKGRDAVRARWARQLLAEDKARSELRRMPYAVQVLRFGKDFALVALSGEPAASYSARIQALLARESVTVAGGIDDSGYCVPGAPNPQSGGTGCTDSIVYLGLPGAFASETEERILDAVKRAWQHAVK